MCNISKLYNQGYIDNYLKHHKFLIANACPEYNKETFNLYLDLYNKYKDKYLCDWFPRLWAIVFYQSKAEQRNFLDIINTQVGSDTSICTFSPNSSIEFRDNRVIITYNNRYVEFVKLDQEKDVG